MASSESVIRRMTRLAVQHDAVNLAQGFTDEPPAYPMVWAAITALLGGTDVGVERIERLTLGDLGLGSNEKLAAATNLERAMERIRGSGDHLSQYSFPFGLVELRRAVADYTQRWYAFRPDFEREITITLGATEGLASVLKAACEPGDGVMIVQPFHEMYPAQADVFGLRPVYVNLTERNGSWRFDRNEWSHAAADARLLVLNTPHNPTGKVFDAGELDFIATLAVDHDLVIVTDEIYEHITFDGRYHQTIAADPSVRDRTVIVNSISKTGNATGWRVGWVIAPAPLTAEIRAIHDTLVIQAPTPLQKATIRLLEMPDDFFDDLRERYASKRGRLMQALDRAGFRVSQPQGAYYLFADYREVSRLARLDSMDAAMCLIEDIGVAAVPGSNFFAADDGAANSPYLRFAFCRSFDSLDEAARRLLALVR